MKKFKYILITVVGLLTMVSCDLNSDADAYTVAEIKTEAGFIVDLTQSQGGVFGIPEDGVPLEDAIINFTDTNLDIVIDLVSGSLDNVEKVELVKYFNNDYETSPTTNEVSVAESTTLPFTVSFNDISDYLDGFSVLEDELRIGDVFNFRIKVYQKGGNILYFNTSMGKFPVTINCFADLSGTYAVTNDACNPNFTTTIEANADGSWHIERGDGGFLSLCTGNSGLLNAADILVVCGEVQPTGNLDFGSAGGTYDIGDISGGTWNQDTGVLIMYHTQSLWSTRPSSWTSTYVRQ
ncbi:hypothetical protein [Tenacibaculum aestuarii]|uniref:hypothetical protein n=1 Tax=Tenacibaculum aestuarii TaxID=362781 RepID=UPI0038960E3E